MIRTHGPAAPAQDSLGCYLSCSADHNGTLLSWDLSAIGRGTGSWKCQRDNEQSGRSPWTCPQPGPTALWPRPAQPGRPLPLPVYPAQTLPVPGLLVTGASSPLPLTAPWTSSVTHCRPGGPSCGLGSLGLALGPACPCWLLQQLPQVTKCCSSPVQGSLLCPVTSVF